MTSGTGTKNSQRNPLVEKEVVGLMNAMIPDHPTSHDPSRLRVYADATVVRGCFEDAFRRPSRQLFDAFAWGDDFTLLLSDHVVATLDAESAETRAVLTRIPDAHSELLATTTSSKELVDAYVRVGAVPESARHHACHFALATLAKADVLVSWDFKNVVNLHRIQFCNYVNVARGHERLAVHTPQALDLPATSISSEVQLFSHVKLLREVRNTISREIQDMTPDEYRQWADSQVHIDPSLRKLARRMAPPTSPAPKPNRGRAREG